ncbi:hypothetical protein ACHAPD_006151 [Fusarium lateritium]
MSDARLSRSSTSSTQAIQALAETVSVNNPPTPQPLLKQDLQNGGSHPSSTGNLASTTHSSRSSFPSSGKNIRASTMFSTIIGHTRGLLPRRESQGQDVVRVGDFDHTPPPSGRPSVDIPKKEDKGEGITSQQLLHKPSRIGNLTVKDQSTSTISKPLLDSVHIRLRDKTWIQPLPNQTPLDLSNVNSDED